MLKITKIQKNGGNIDNINLTKDNFGGLYDYYANFVVGDTYSTEEFTSLISAVSSLSKGCFELAVTFSTSFTNAS